jgi:hypothetical protein
VTEYAVNIQAEDSQFELEWEPRTVLFDSKGVKQPPEPSHAAPLGLIAAGVAVVAVLLAFLVRWIFQAKERP